MGRSSPPENALSCGVAVLRRTRGRLRMAARWLFFNNRQSAVVTAPVWADVTNLA
ncbi:hypothetical protein AOG2_19940 [Geobacter sp. AOG2]|nr:hypothetical protein AOG2_19940 [Geobacter sp. AOG2]